MRKIERVWIRWVEFWSTITGLNKALKIASVKLSYGKKIPFLAKLRVLIWDYTSFRYWIHKIRQRKIRKLERKLQKEGKLPS